MDIAANQGETTKRNIILMLGYEGERQRRLLERRWIQHRIDEKQKKEYEKVPDYMNNMYRLFYNK